MQVRGLVRNVTKAQELLPCGECGPEDGIFVGDVTDPDTLTAAFAGARRLVILTGTPTFASTNPQPSAFPMPMLTLANTISTSA